MRACLALVLCASLAHAEPKDAPVAERPAMTLKAGEVVPFDAVCMTDGKTLEVGKRIASCEASLAVVETKTVISTPILVGGLVAVIVLAFAAGAAAGFAASR